jgi:5-methylcytosine-specific restriction endonuclease McrA
MTRTKGLRFRSKKRERVMVVRRELVAALAEAFPICQRCGKARSVDPHEKKKRSRGGSILDPANIAMLCRACHEFTEAEPELAEAEGWLTPSWK